MKLYLKIQNVHANVWWWPFERWHQIKIEEVHQKFCPRPSPSRLPCPALLAFMAAYWPLPYAAGRRPAPSTRGPDFRARARAGHQDHQGQVPRNVFFFVWNDYHLSFPLFFCMTKATLKVIYPKHCFWADWVIRQVKEIQIILRLFLVCHLLLLGRV